MYKRQDLSIGYNGSENFAEGKRFGTFPAGSVGWIISEEKFMEPLKPYVSYLTKRIAQVVCLEVMGEYFSFEQPARGQYADIFLAVIRQELFQTVEMCIRDSHSY